MTFRKIDAAAITADLALASPLGRYIADSHREAQQTRLRACTHLLDVRQPPLMCGLPAGDGGDVVESPRAGLPYLWRKTTRATQLTVRVRHDVKVQPVTVGACVLPLREQLRAGVSIPPTEDSELISSTGETTTELVLDLSPYAADELLIVWITWASGVTSTSTELLDASDDSALQGWGPRGVLLAAPDHWVDASTWTDEIAPYLISLVSGGAKGSEADAEYDPERSPNPMPSGRLALRFSDAGEAIYVWPPYGYANTGGDAPDPTTEYVRRTEIGYSEVFGVELRESSATPLPDYGTAFDPLQPTSYLAAQQLYTQGEELFRTHTRVLAIAPQIQPPDLDPVSALGYQLRWGRRRAVGAAATEIASCLVGNGDGYTNAAGSSKSRVRYQVDALLALIAPGLESEAAADLAISSYCTDLDGGNASTPAVATFEGVAPNWATPNNASDRISPTPGNWLGFWGEERTGDWARHVLKGAWPEELVRSWRVVPVSLEVLDDSSAERRRLTFTVRWGDESNLPRSLSIYCVVVAFGVRDAPRALDALIGA